MCMAAPERLLTYRRTPTLTSPFTRTLSQVAGEYPSGTSGGGLGSIPGSATVLQAGQGVHVILPSGGGGSSHATASGDSPYLQRLPPVMRRSVSGTGARPHTQRVFAGGRERDGRPNDPAAGGGFEALAAQSSEL